MFSGATYVPSQDQGRLQTQLGKIYFCMHDHKWRTLSEISQMTGAPESSVSAQLRNLKKPAHGGYILNKRSRGERSHGLFEYQIEDPALTPYPPEEPRSPHQ